MSSSCLRSMCLIAGAALAGGPLAPAPAQDANRDVVITRSDVAGIVDRLAKRSGDFKGEFDDAVSHSTIDGTRLEGNAKHRADDLHDSAKRLASVFRDKHDKNHPAVRNQADKTIASASELNRIMLDHRFTDKLQQNWDLLRSDSIALAGVYGLSPLQGERQGR